jgi:hypothetical protein
MGFTVSLSIGDFHADTDIEGDYSPDLYHDVLTQIRVQLLRLVADTQALPILEAGEGLPEISEGPEETK